MSDIDSLTFPFAIEKGDFLTDLNVDCSSSKICAQYHCWGYKIRNGSSAHVVNHVFNLMSWLEMKSTTKVVVIHNDDTKEFTACET